MTETLQLAISVCELSGYSVIPKVRWVTPISIARELGMSGSWLHKQLHDFNCPPYEAQFGATGRTIKLRLTPDLHEWLKARIDK